MENEMEYVFIWPNGSWCYEKDYDDCDVNLDEDSGIQRIKVPDDFGVFSDIDDWASFVAS